MCESNINTVKQLEDTDITELLKRGEIYKIITPSIFGKPSNATGNENNAYFKINYLPWDAERGNINYKDEIGRCVCYRGNKYLWTFNDESGEKTYNYEDDSRELLYCYLPQPHNLGALTVQCIRRDDQPVFFSTGSLTSCVVCAILFNDKDKNTNILLVHVGNDNGGDVKATEEARKKMGINYRALELGEKANEIRCSIVYKAVKDCLKIEDNTQDFTSFDELETYFLNTDSIVSGVMMRMGQKGEIETEKVCGNKKFVDYIYSKGGLTALINDKGPQVLAGEYNRHAGQECQFHCLRCPNSGESESLHNKIEKKDSDTQQNINGKENMGSWDKVSGERGCCILL